MIRTVTGRTRPGSTTTWLGGKDHFAADREARRDVLFAVMPEGPGQLPWANRPAWARAVTFPPRRGRDLPQFLDIGTGLPVSP